MVKIKGVNMDYKQLAIKDLETEQTEEGYYIQGYANTKNTPDAYGDIPTNYEGKPVYDLSRFKKNPVFLADHEVSVGNIIGVFTELKEDEKGLWFKAKLMESPQTDIAKHAIEAIKQGFSRALSIGGKWFFEDPNNPTHLTKAYIHEISAVAVGADGNALSTQDIPKQLTEKISKGTSLDEIEPLLNAFRKKYVDEINQYKKEHLNG